MKYNKNWYSYSRDIDLAESFGIIEFHPVVVENRPPEHEGGPAEGDPKMDSNLAQNLLKIPIIGDYELNICDIKI